MIQDTFQQPPPAPVICDESSKLLAGDVEGRLLLWDLDDQAALCRRQSATVIEQVFDAIDFTKQKTDPRVRGHGISTTPSFSSLISAQYHYLQGTACTIGIVFCLIFCASLYSE